MLGGILMLILAGMLVTCGIDVMPPIDIPMDDVGIW